MNIDEPVEPVKPFSMHDLVEPFGDSTENIDGPVNPFGFNPEAVDNFLEACDYFGNMMDIDEYFGVREVPKNEAALYTVEKVSVLVDTSLVFAFDPSVGFAFDRSPSPTVTPETACDDDAWDDATLNGSPQGNNSPVPACDTANLSMEEESSFDTSIFSMEADHTIDTTMSSEPDCTFRTSISGVSPATEEQPPNSDFISSYQLRLGSFVDAVSSKMRKPHQPVRSVPKSLTVPATATISYLVHVFSRTTGLLCDESLQFTHQDITSGTGLTQLTAMMETAGLFPSFQVFTSKGRRDIDSQSAWDEAILDIYNGRELGEIQAVVHMFV